MIDLRIRPRRWSTLLQGFIICLLVPGLAVAQDDKELAPVTRTYAITNATVVQGPGRKIDRATVIIKDGLIIAVGKGVAVPPEAIEIKGDSLHVYAGFIDGLSRTGVTKPKEESGQRERVANPGNPPPEKAGITPQVDVRSHINPADKSVEEFRNAGFTVAQVVPYGVLLPGSASIVSFNGQPVDQMVLSGKSALYSELSGNQGVYPSNILGIMAKWRELYRQAAQARSYEGMYAANRSGLPRPETNRVLEAFYPVVDKNIPVLFKAEKLLDVHRVLTLQSELGFPLVLADLKEAWDVTAKIKAANAKVFLSLELPEEVKDEKKDKEDVKSDAEVVALGKRKTDFIAKYDAQAAAFQKAGIKFGFAGLDVKASSVQANLRRMIKAGLTEDQALAALTTSPAELLGMSDRLGTVDNGKMANLVLSDKPYFDEKAKVKFVFVDGILFKQEAKDAKKDSNVKVDVTGTWTVSAETPNGKSESTLNISKSGDSYSGKISGANLPQAVDLNKVEVDGNSLKYTYAINVGGSQSLTVEVDATVEGDSFKGTATAGTYGSFPIEGKKDPK
jgi:imidazolonepropionase-like amidohydrolase